MRDDKEKRSAEKAEEVKCYGGTDITRALRFSLDNMFQTSNGMRDNVEKVALILTDGKDSDDNNQDDYKDVKKRFVDRNIQLLVIGVGGPDVVDESKLKCLVQNPDYLFLPKDFDDLQELTSLIGSKICEGT